MDKLIYIADDDNNIRNLLKSFLERENFNVVGFTTGDDLYDRFKDSPCDLIILDVMMPGHDGFFILREIRKSSNVPIIMLTAKDSDSDYIQGLNSGSDDYFTKPFSPVKLVTKVKSVLKRQEEIAGKSNESANTNEEELVFADIVINRKTKEATMSGRPFPLTPNEYSLLTYLIHNQDRAVSRAELLDKIWGYETQVETRVADDTVKRLRKKIQSSQAKITTVWGYGFRLINRMFAGDNDDEQEDD
ncbi:MAG: response regulator transcription factor [Saccharofermentans sp.]|jgi:DNA-binding response OmpR family regulator|nr:response regulator transcription factor [Mageeibacillus sp.]MCI1264063.1 response regulator transcription factor [Saccharofermentans sp.]MCI1274914.1 response regulator transcription factor [Saccharofermentans sp.]MCI1769583.1 response regulator transcription factor [Mageeibacillus sp.]MCI2044011.1 response regulator transcription factor [Mageeibacillus sp.]